MLFRSTPQMPARSRSPSPVVEGKQQRSRSPSIVDNGKQQRSRSPSPSIKQKPEQLLIESMSAEESPLVNASPRRSPSPTIEQKSESSLTNFNSVDSHHEQRKKSSPSVSPMNETKEQRMGSESSETARENRSKLSGSTDKLHETFHSSDMPVGNLKKDHSSRSPSIASPVRQHTQPITDANNEFLSESTLPKHDEKLPHSNNHGKPHVSPLASPMHAPRSSEADTTERRLSTQQSSFDQHHRSSASIPIPSMDRHSSIPRSLSQTSLARPTTLRFSPNDHDLDGLYMPDQYNDEDLLVDGHEHHRSSAPSTTSLEFRRPSLAQDHVGEQTISAINPIEISTRLSLVEKSRMKGIAAAFASGDAFIGWVILWCSSLPPSPLTFLSYYFGNLDACRCHMPSLVTFQFDLSLLCRF